MRLRKPIIITGMHRSGTTLIVKLLEKNGVFLGSIKDENKESIFFQRINRWLVSFNDSYWDNPKTFKCLNNEDNDLLVLKLKKTLSNRFLNSMFFGYKNIFSNKNFKNYPSLWGWKDPVNTFTIDIWKKIFPDLSIININRAPLDVSCSLLNRQKKLRIKDNKNNNSFINSFVPLLSVNKGSIYRSFNLNNIDDCLILCKKYYEQIKINNKSNVKSLNIDFESLINNPEQEILKIYNFCGIIDYNLNDDCRLVNQNILDKYKDYDLIYDKELLESINYE